jgi:hypothetical protein
MIPRARPMRRDERGSASVELLGMLPWLLLAALVVWQILLLAWTATSASNAARTGSRVEGRGGDGQRAAVDSLSGGLSNEAKVRIEGDRARVEVRVPIIVPGLDTDRITITRNAELPSG